MVGHDLPSWIHLFLDTPDDRWEEGVAFWAAATHCQVSQSRGERGQFVTLLPSTGDPWLKMQSVPDVSARVHLDLDFRDPQGAVGRTLARHGSLAWTYQDVPVLRSPGGLLVCHTKADPNRQRRMERADQDTVADQVCLDIPARLWDEEVVFWQQLTGRELVLSPRPEFAVLSDPDPAGAPRILLQRLAAYAAAVSAHIDLATRDRAAVTRLHERLGARVVDVRAVWTVMTAPSGHTYCLTDRDPRTGRLARAAATEAGEAAGG